MKHHERVGHCLPLLMAAWIACAVVFHPALARADLGVPVADAELPTLDGGRMRLLGSTAASVLIFFRPGQERSETTLLQIERCRKPFTGKPVHWVAIVSGAADRDSAKTLVRRAGLSMPVLVDEDDGLYAQLGVAQHPAVVVVGADRRIAAYEPYRAINFCTAIAARVQRLLGEMSASEMQRAIDPPPIQRGADTEVARRYRALAQTQYAAGHFERALANVRRSLELDPTAAGAHVLLGNILASQGQCAQAELSFQKARALAPDTRTADAATAGCAN